MTDVQTPANIFDLTSKAVKAALNRDWPNAIKYNLEIAKSDPKNPDVLNRLAFAYLQTGKSEEAKKIYERILKIDPFNSIAQKNILKISVLKDIKCRKSKLISPLEFIEDPGKTKIVQCVNQAPVKILSSIECGDELILKVKNHSIEVRDMDNRYLGALPDDLSFRMIRFIQGNNTYQVIAKTINKNIFCVLIRETGRGKKFANQPSFTNQLTTSTVSCIDSPLTHDKPDVTPTGEEDDADQSADNELTS